MKVTTSELDLNMPPFGGEAHYIGSFPRDGEIYDYYEVAVNGEIAFVFVKADHELGKGDEGNK